MILNDKEKAELIKALKKQYADNKEFIENNNFPLWVQDKEQRKDFIFENEKIKDQYEALESRKDFEIDIPLYGNVWGAMLGLAAIAFLGCSFNGTYPENDTNLN